MRDLPTALSVAIARVDAMPDPEFDLFANDADLHARLRRAAAASLDECARSLARHIDADILRMLLDDTNVLPRHAGPHIIPSTHGGPPHEHHP